MNREARAVLFLGAERAFREGVDAQTWLERLAPQWALDVVSQREVDAVVAMVWRPLR